MEDPETKLSVVYRADNYDDGSNDEAPLYPLDYPPRQVDRRPSVRRQVGVQVDGVDRLGQRDQSRDSRLASGSTYEDQSRDFRVFAQKDEPRNSRMTDRFAQTRDQFRDPSDIRGFGNTQDQPSDFGTGQRFVQRQEDSSRDILDDELTQSREDESRDSSIDYGFMNTQESQASDFRKAQMFEQLQDQLREFKVTDRFNQPRDQSRNPSVILGFINTQDQANGFGTDQRFVQDQSRDSRTTDRFVQRQDRSRDPSSILAPEVRFDSRDPASNFNIMKMIHQMEAVLANRSSLEDRKEENNLRAVEKQGGQWESQVIQKINDGDQGNKGVDPREKQLQEEVKEKRGAADRKITADDQLDWSGAELVPLQTTTELPVLDLTKLETMG